MPPLSRWRSGAGRARCFHDGHTYRRKQHHTEIPLSCSRCGVNLGWAPDHVGIRARYFHGGRTYTPKQHHTDMSQSCSRCGSNLGWASHPALTPMSDGRCSFLGKLPAELRTKIYQNIWTDSAPSSAPPSSSANNGNRLQKRRIYWRGACYAKLDDSTTTVEHEARERRQLVDTAIFSVCKQIAEEAPHELMRNSIVVVEVVDIKDLLTHQNMLNSMRCVEIRDTANSEGRQLWVPPKGHSSNVWTDEETLQLDLASALQLKQIGTLLANSPSLKSLVIGFAVLRVYNVRGGPLSSRLLPLISCVQRACRNLETYVLSSFTCIGYGKWRAHTEEGVTVDIKHFNLASIVDRASASPMQCECGGDPYTWIRAWLAAEKRGDYDLANILYLRHFLGENGWLDEEALRRCNPARRWLENRNSRRLEHKDGMDHANILLDGARYLIGSTGR